MFFCLLSIDFQLNMEHPITIRGVDTLYDSLPPNKEGVADTGTTIGVALLSGFALMLLCVFRSNYTTDGA
jgi:hypothetical protein